MKGARAQVLLRSFGFDTTIDHPQPLAVHYLLLLRAPRGLCEASLAVLNDAASASADEFAPWVLATAAIAVAAEFLQVRLRDQWWVAFDVQEAELVPACHVLLAAYEHIHRQAVPGG